MNRLTLTLAVAAGLAALAGPVGAQEAGADLAQRLTALEANAEFSGMAAYERLQARQSIEMLAAAGSREREGARYVAERRVRIAEVAAGTAAAQREIDRLDRERAELLIEASRQDAAQARAEAERLRMEARIQAEEAARQREQAMSSEEAMQDVEAALKRFDFGASLRQFGLRHGVTAQHVGEVGVGRSRQRQPACVVLAPGGHGRLGAQQRLACGGDFGRGVLVGVCAFGTHDGLLGRAQLGRGRRHRGAGRKRQNEHQRKRRPTKVCEA